jgi:hypothetical protein
MIHAPFDPGNSTPGFSFSSLGEGITILVNITFADHSAVDIHLFIS